MKKKLRIPTRKRTEPKPVCPLCNCSPTSLHWTDEWLHWHQVHWCQVLREQRSTYPEDTRDNVRAPPLAHEDNTYDTEDVAFPYSHFADANVYRTRSMVAQLTKSQSSISVEEPDEGAHNTPRSACPLEVISPCLDEDSNSGNDCGSFPSEDDNTVQNIGISADKPIDVSNLVSFMTTKQMAYSLTQENEVSLLYRQPAFFAVQQFLSQHPQQSQTATNDLLKLIKHLTSPQIICYTTQLPVTENALWREVHDNIRSSATYYSKDDDLISLSMLQRYQDDDLSKVLGLHVREVAITETLTVQVPYFDIVAVILDIIINNIGVEKDGKGVLSFNHTTSYFGGEDKNNVIYNDITTGLWWKELEEKLPPTQLGAKRKIIALLPYLDGVSVDFFDSISMIPWVISLGNLERDHRAKLSSKRLVAFIPNPCDEVLRLQAGICGDVSELRKEILNKSLEIVLSPILQLQSIGGLCFKLPGSHVPDVFYPVIPFFIGDNKELNKLAGVRTGHLTNRQCRFCTCLSVDMNNFYMGAQSTRKISDIDKVTDSRNRKQLLKDMSVVQNIDKSFLFKNNRLFGGLGRDTAFFESFPPDNLHSLYAGVVKYTVCWTLDLMKCYSKGPSLVELDNIFLQHFRSGSSVDAEFKFIVPKKGLSKIAILSGKSKKTKIDYTEDKPGNILKRKEVTGSGGQNKNHTSKFRSKAWGAILVALAFTLGCSPEDKLLPSDHIEHGRVRDIVMQALVSIMHVFFELQRTEYTEKGLQTLEYITIPDSLTHLYQIYRIRQKYMKRADEFHGIKLHIMLHIPHLIRRFGAPMNWDTNTYESSHKAFVKRQWESGAKRTEDLELNTLKSYKFWCEICQRSGVTSNGRLVPSYHLSEKYVAVNVRRWRRNFSDNDDRPNLPDTDSSISYKFTVRGHPLCFKEKNETSNFLTVRSRFVLDPERKTICDQTQDNDTRSYFKPHSLVSTHLLELLMQFSRAQNGALLSEAFQSPRQIALGNMKIILHEHILIKGEGIMEGYSDFRIYATNNYGTSKVRKCRYDVVEVTIPKDCGGNIAGNDNLMRINKDTAIARVLTIVTLQYYERELCLLFLQFMKKTFPEGKQGTYKRHVNRYLKEDSSIYYGKGQRTWLALYPLITLKGPALFIMDPYHEDYGHVLPLKFICRGGWWPETTLDENMIIQYIPQQVPNQSHGDHRNFRSGAVSVDYHDEYSSDDEDEWIESNSDHGSSDKEDA